MRTLVIGDLHLGCGACPNVFSGARAFAALLADAAALPTRVVLNGDTFDFVAQDASRGVSPEQVMHMFTEDPTNGALLAALGGVLRRGGALVVRAGEHDHALADRDVQAVLVRAITGTDEGSPRLGFAAAHEPTLLSIGGVRVVVTHDVHDHDEPATRRLAARLLNQLRRQYGVGYADLLRPSYADAVIAALAVNPTAAKLVLRLVAADEARAGDELGELLRRSRAFARAGLSPREREVLASALDPAIVTGMRSEESEVLEQARVKLFRLALAERGPAADAGPRQLTGAEWAAIRRMAVHFQAGAVIVGHSRAVGWRSEADLTAVDAGTWTWLVDPPAPGSGEAVWRHALATWQRAARISGAPSRPLFHRWTAALLDPHPVGGARLALVEWRADGGLACLRESWLPGSSA